MKHLFNIISKKNEALKDEANQKDKVKKSKNNEVLKMSNNVMDKK